MTNEELKKDWEVIEAATQGPWDVIYQEDPELGKEVYGISSHDETIVETDAGFYPPSELDAEFISQARSRWPEALREVERLQDVLMYISQMSKDEAEMFAAKHAKKALKEILK